MNMDYTELQVTSNFSFLRGASHPEEMVEQAIAYGYETIAITDRNSFAGVVRAHAAAKRISGLFRVAGSIYWMEYPCLLIPLISTPGQNFAI